MLRARHLLRSSVAVMALFALGKFVGLFRARLVAQTFGTSPEYDAFTAANQLPEVFFVVIAGGSLAAAFIPVYSRYLHYEPRSESARLANTVLTLVMLLLGTISALGALAAPWLAQHILVPDFPPAQQQLTADIMRIILIQTTIFGIGGVLSSILNAHQHFILPALATLALDIGYFVGLFAFVPTLGIMGLAWGTVVGGVLFVLIQLPALARYGIRYKPQLAIRMQGIRELVRLMGPRIVTLGTIQVADLIIIRLASGLPTGATSGYFYAYGLMQFPQTLFGTAIALVVFPTLAELYNAGDREGLKRAAANTLSIIWTLTIPAAAITVLLGKPIIEFIFQGGAFDEQATQLVYTILVVLSIRIVSESTLEIVARLFYARHNTVVPMLAYLGWFLLVAVASVLLVRPLGVVGLAFASALGFTLLAAVLFELNRRELGGLGGRALQRSFVRSAAGTAFMSLAIVLAGRLIDNTFLFLAMGLLVGGVVYLIATWLMGGRELSDLWRIARGKQVSQQLTD
ncbi:MAG TPA: murein biosynthesis integral membrane protein MurJ [Promineifilum sp.]|nr:murein biosynthesis integral membrane protein MurJ [Promineifilum sp.]